MFLHCFEFVFLSVIQLSKTNAAKALRILTQSIILHSQVTRWFLCKFVSYCTRGMQHWKVAMLCLASAKRVVQFYYVLLYLSLKVKVIIRCRVIQECSTAITETSCHQRHIGQGKPSHWPFPRPFCGSSETL